MFSAGAHLPSMRFQLSHVHVDSGRTFTGEAAGGNWPAVKTLLKRLQNTFTSLVEEEKKNLMDYVLGFSLLF